MFKYYIVLVLCFTGLQNLLAQEQRECVPTQGLPVAGGSINFNYGSVSNAFSPTSKMSFTIGQPYLGVLQSQENTMEHGFWARLYLPPSAPAIMASQGDFPDRVEIMWDVDPLSSQVTNGFRVLRDGSFLTETDSDTRQFIDFNVQAGEFYQYSVIGRNSAGSGFPGESIGFVNPNGTATGQVTTQAGNPVVGAVVTLSPTIGRCLAFDGIDDHVCIDYNENLPDSLLTVSAWIKIEDGYDSDGIIDLGSDIGKNWWIHTTPSDQGKGIVLGIGDSTATTMSYEFEEDPDGWHQVAMVYGGGTILMYVDGVFKGSKMASIGFEPALFNVGCRRDKTGFFHGMIDDIRIFDDLVNQSTLINTSLVSVSKNTANLVAYWKFDEGLGNKVFDIGINKMHGRLYGPAFSADCPNIQNAGITDEGGFYSIEGVNYSSVQSFSAKPSKKFYDNYSLEFNAARKGCAMLTSFDVEDNATIEALFYPFELESKQSILSNAGASGVNDVTAADFNLFIENHGLYLTINGETQSLDSVSMGYVHVSLTIDSSKNEVTYHKNGAFGKTLSYGDVTGNWSSTPWMVAAYGDSLTQASYYTGLVDEVSFYDTILSITTIQLNASPLGTGGTDVGNANLFAYFNFNEGENTELYDYGPGMTGTGVLKRGNFSVNTFKQASSPHLFLPSSRVVNINASNTATGNIDFSDVSTISVTGVVRYENTFCYAEGVEILVNGSSYAPPIITDAEGKWSADFDPGAKVVLTPKLEDHLFLPGFFEIKKLNTPVAGVLFQDQTKRQIVGQLAGGLCRKSVITPNAIVKVNARALNGCYEKEVQITNSDGNYVIEDVPPIPYTVAVTEHSNNVIKDFFQNVGGEEIDLTAVESDTVDFIYFSAPLVEIDTPIANACGIRTLAQGVNYQTGVRVYQQYDGGRCYLNEAPLTIDNGWADADQVQVQMENGEYIIEYLAGLPILAEPYTKALQVSTMVDGSIGSSVIEAVVLGKRPRITTFQSKSPAIPFLILRDPPGDGSYAYMEENSEVCQTFSVDISSSTGSEQSIKTSLGADVTTSVGFGVAVELTVETTADVGVSATLSYQEGLTNEAEMCITNTKRYETSQLDDLVGSSQGGDLFVGAAINFIYGITDDLMFKEDSCKFYLENTLTVFPGGFDTEFIYTQNQIQGVIIPELENLGDTTSVNQWKEILALNQELKEKATFIKNLTFDAGPVYEESQESSKSESTTFSYETGSGGELATAFGVKVNGVGVEGGVTTTFSFDKSQSATNSNTNTRTVGFVFTDDDANDNFTVNILEDKRYATPVFELVAGQSMCPWELGTQNREEVSLTIDKNIADNVPSNGKAVFKVTIANVSQSAQTMNYILAIPPGYNPDGADIKIIGANFLTPIQLKAFESKEFTVTVERGPEEYTYTDLRIAAYSECEYDRALGLGNDPRSYDESVFTSNPFYKEMSVDVYFVEPCSEVDLAQPSNNVITPTTGDIFFLTVNGYNKSDADLELIRLQYRPSNGNGAWINIKEVSKDTIGPLFEIVSWQTEDLEDGLYEVRAITSCTSVSLAPGVSTILSIRIERQPPEVFGTPQPADGVLSPPDEISIQFTKRIDCNQIFLADGIGTNINNNNLGVYYAASGALVDVSVTCSEDKIIILPNVANKFIENQVLRVQVQDIKDLVGNTMEEPAIWEFFVNRSSLYWAGGSIEEMTKEGESLTITREIRNQGGAIMDYTLEDIPDWLEVFPSVGSLEPGTFKNISFSFSNDIVVGEYEGLINMTTAEGQEPLPVYLRVACEGPDWQVNPSDFSNTMNFTVELDIEGTFSTDVLDQIAAFVDDEIRGVAYISYEPSLDKYLAFLTVHSNEVVGETVEFKIWDARECLLYGTTLESFPFVADDLVGSPVTPQVIHTNNLVLREIPLYPGWNWFSYNLAIPDSTINAALSSLQSPQGALIKGQTAFSQYFDAASTWAGSLTELTHFSMYQYKSQSFDTLKVLGRPIDPAANPLTLQPGWNWIGYLPLQGLPVNDALASLAPLQGDVIKGQGTFAQYVAGVGWIGNLNFMSSPNGYQINLANGGVLTYPANFTGDAPTELLRNPSLATERSAATVWEVNEHEFELSMNMVAILQDLDGFNVLNENDEIGAFIDGEVRGSGKPIYVEAIDSWMLFLTMYANAEGGRITFKYFDATAGAVKPVADELIFISNTILGEVENPVVLTLDASTNTRENQTEPTEFLLYPNPARSTIYLSFVAQAGEEVQVRLLDAFGRQILAQETTAKGGANLLEWDISGNPPGLYFVTLETPDYVHTKKLEIQ